MRRALVFAALAVVLTAPAAADAAAKRLATNLGSVYDRNVPIAFAAGRIVFLNQPQSSKSASIESVSLAGKRKRLVTVKPKGKNGRMLMRFDAAGNRLVYSGVEEIESGPDVGDSRSAEVHTGPIDGPYPEVDGCHQTGRFGPLDVLAAPNAILHRSFGCEPEADTLRGFSGPGYVRRLGSPSPFQYLYRGMAGNFVIGSPPGTQAYGVYDHVNDRFVDELSPSFATRVQDDGTAVSSDGTPFGARACGAELRVHTAAGPGGTPLPVRVCGAAFAVAGSRIAAERLTASGPEVVSMNLAGGDVRVLAKLADVNALNSLDTDGKRVAWHVSGCYVDSLYVADLTGKPVRRGLTHCPLELRAKAIPVRKGKAKIPIVCAKGCNQVQANLTFPGAGTVAGARRTRHKPGKATLTVKLTKAQLGLVKKGKARKVQLVIDWVDQDNQNPKIFAKVKLVAP
jgi:hypothetical protein